jgi:hypothetical protein
VRQFGWVKVVVDLDIARVGSPAANAQQLRSWKVQLPTDYLVHAAALNLVCPGGRTRRTSDSRPRNKLLVQDHSVPDSVHNGTGMSRARLVSSVPRFRS